MYLKKMQRAKFVDISNCIKFKWVKQIPVENT